MLGGGRPNFLKICFSIGLTDSNLFKPGTYSCYDMEKSSYAIGLLTLLSVCMFCLFSALLYVLNDAEVLLKLLLCISAFVGLESKPISRNV